MTEQTEIERALRAVRDADWRQVILNGGPPCFHFEQERQLFCLRAERWAGHGKAHLFVPLESLLSAMQKQAVFGAYAAAAKHFPYFRDGEWKSCRCGWKATYAAPLIYCQKDFTDQYAQHILALTPADAWQASQRRPIGNRFHCFGDIIKNSNGEVLPVDEPLFLIRARDYLAIPMLERYRKVCQEDGGNDYIDALFDEIIREFVRFSVENPTKMKQPGSTRGL